MKLFQSRDPTIPTAAQLTSHVHDEFGTAESSSAMTADKLLNVSLAAIGNATRSGNAQFFRDGNEYGVRIVVPLTGKDLRTYFTGRESFRASQPGHVDDNACREAFDTDLTNAITARLTKALVTDTFGYSKASASVKVEDAGEDTDYTLDLRLEWNKSWR